jgi:dGTPase
VTDAGVAGYGPEAVARLVAEPDKRTARSPFARDRARVLHSAGLRRLAATTQVVEPGISDFPRTRLTHSLECAQIARELGDALGCDPDLVDCAGLSHDLGHPPFGHNGESVLDRLAETAGGFEGNAQTFRVLTRLEPKASDADGRPAGLNLTRASLDAAAKYPWPRSGPGKFGVYDDDRSTFDWMRQGAPDRTTCLEAQVMDFADDVAYSVHDLEDGIHAGHVDLALLHDEAALTESLSGHVDAYAPGADAETVAASLGELVAELRWPRTFAGTRGDLAALKALTSALIGLFCSEAVAATTAVHGDGLRRYGAGLVVPGDTRLRVAGLKALAASAVMHRPQAQRRYAEQREILEEVFEYVRLGAPETLSPEFRASFGAAGDDAARLRVVVDQVASYTDLSALALHRRLP